MHCSYCVIIGVAHPIITRQQMYSHSNMDYFTTPIPDQLSVLSWRSLGWYDTYLFDPPATPGGPKDERHLCASSVGLKAGVYHVGLMWQCNPEYSWIQGAVDHTFCEPKYIDEDGDLSPRNDCWSGVWQNYYLEGCVPDATQFAGEFLGYFATLQEAKDWCVAANPLPVPYLF